MFFTDPTSNINPETGMRYGVIDASDAQHLFEEIVDNGTNTTYKAYVESIDKQIKHFFEEKEDHLDNVKGFFSEFYLDEEMIEQFIEEIMKVEGELSDDDLFALREIFLQHGVELDEENYRYEKDGEIYETSYLSGPTIWVIKSPVTALVDPCSPCAPNAGNLNNPNPEGVLCYAVPVEWFDDDHPCPYTTQPVFVIPAECHSDDCFIEIDFDALDWFKQASDKEIQDLVNCNYGGDYPADKVVDFFGATTTGELFTYTLKKKHGKGGMGFECTVVQESAEKWIKANCPSIVLKEAFLIDEEGTGDN